MQTNRRANCRLPSEIALVSRAALPARSRRIWLAGGSVPDGNDGNSNRRALDSLTDPADFGNHPAEPGLTEVF